MNAVPAVFEILGGGNMDRFAKGHSKWEGAGGGCAASRVECKAKTTSVLSEWEAKKFPLLHIIVQSR